MKRLLTHSTSFPSAKLLRNSLQEITGEKIWVTSNPAKITEPFVSYGSSASRFEHLNSNSLISLLSNKRRSSEVFLENGIYTPEFRKDKPNKFPVLIRTTLTSSKCKGIIPCLTETDFNKNWNSSYYWTQYIPLAFELRVHIANGKILRIFRKELEDESGDIVIRNNDNCHFSLRTVEKYPKLLEAVNKVISIFGTESFLALDIGWDANKKDYFFIEGNSAPGLNENTSESYALEIVEILKNRGLL